MTTRPCSSSPSSTATLAGWLANPARHRAREQPVARAVAGEDPARPVAPVGRRRQPDHHHAAPEDHRSPARAAPSSPGRRRRARRGAPPPLPARPPGAGNAGTTRSRLPERPTPIVPALSRGGHGDSVRWHVVANLRRASPRAGRGSRAAVGGTLVLLVRHGSTPTTGKLLPGRAPGLQLSEQGRAQAERVAERIGELGRPPDRGLRVAPRADPGDGQADRATPRPAGAQSNGAARVRLRHLDRAKSLRQLAQRQEWRRCRVAELVPLSRRRVLRRHLGARLPGDASSSPSGTRGRPIVAVSHADPIKAIVAAAAGVPLDLFQRLVDLPLLGDRARLRGPGARGALRQRHRLARRAGAVMSDRATDG